MTRSNQFFEKSGRTDRIADWQHWMDSSISLGATQATVARELPAEQTIDKLARPKGSHLAETMRLYKDPLKRLLVEIRGRGYAIRTEQTYESRVARFFSYCDNQAPENLGANEIKWALTPSPGTSGIWGPST